MAKLNIPPTKSNHQRLKHDLGFAREGYEMLEQKRQILVLELIGTVESAKRAQEEVREKMAAAYQSLREALLRRGALQMAAESVAPQEPHTTEVATRPLMGIYLPTVKADHPPRRPAVGLMASSAALDEAAGAFRDALAAIDRLAEVENTVFRLAREVRKTIRRVNALDKIFIPSYEDTLGFIQGVLEEKERDEFVIMRMVRERLEKTRQPGETAAGMERNA